MSAPVQAGSAVETSTLRAIGRAAEYLAGLQKADGHWCGELTADTTLESDYILFQLWLYPPQGGNWEPPSRPRIEKAAQSILRRQLSDGGFPIYENGPSEISASVKAYCALKLAGLAPSDARMTRLRSRVLELGGVQAANSYVKINLSLFGLYPREYCPSIPPEVMLLPFDFLYQMSSWTRAIVVSLAIVHAADPRRPVPSGFTLEDIWLPGARPGFQRDGSALSARNLFLSVDRIVKWWEAHGSKAIRRKAVKRAHEWMLERLEHSDGLGAIYPPMMYSVMALDTLGYAADDPVRQAALRQFERLMVERNDAFYFQPCFSPVWDTAISAYALAQHDPDREALKRASEWLMAREVRRKGDWSVKKPGVEPSGWAFEYANEHYPDIDDTAMALLALGAADGGADDGRGCRQRALNWLLAMQSSDGGWAAFDADNNWGFLSKVPFADHNAMLDPTCPDITGRVLEALGACGLDGGHQAVRRGVEWLVRNQEPDGSWYGRWGVAYIYGTCFALRGLAASGENDREAHILRAGEWLRSIQNADGGWGESCASYDRGMYVNGPSTPSQTAWAVMGLIAGGDSGSLSVQHGIEYLLENQHTDGTWRENLATGTGFPRVFYLNYHLYKDYFPLLALASFVKARAGSNG